MNRKDAWQRIGNAADIKEQSGMVFALGADNFFTGFAVRYKNQIRCYVNKCPHQGGRLDWTPGEFFTDDKRHLICATHGARFEPLSGKCVSGPCKNASLTRLRWRTEDGEVWVEALPPK